MHIDSFVDFDFYVSQVVSTCMYHLKNIAKIKRLLTRAETEKLVHAFMTSTFDYCNSLLYRVKLFLLSKLQAVQNKTARIVLNLPPFVSVTGEMLNELHWLKFDR